MIIHLVRHATAGSRSAWTDNDDLRPLDVEGRRQADALAERLAPLGIDRVLSSPAVRCRQTLVPLAERTGTPVEDVVELAEGAPPAPALALLAALTTDTAVSAHGDLIPQVIEHLAALGMQVEGPSRCQKGSTWAVERHNGLFTVGRYTPPP